MEAIKTNPGLRMSFPTDPQATQDPTAPARSDPNATLAQPDTTEPSPAPGFDPPAQPGEAGTLGPYRVLTELGRGGMGAVYPATDTRLNRKLALKVMIPQFGAAP